MYLLTLVVILASTTQTVDLKYLEQPTAKYDVLDTKVCKVDPTMAVDVCYEEKADGQITLLDLHDTRFVPEHALCELGNGNDSLTTVRCLDNAWKVTARHTKSTVVNERQKRIPLGLVIAGVVVVTAVLCFIFCSESTNAGPRLDCPKIDDVTASIRSLTAKVSWHPPVATDPEDGQIGAILTSGQEPNSVFAEGLHTISYMARDREGATATCSSTFSVKVTRCDPRHTNMIENGGTSCSPNTDPYIYGSTCTYTCDQGYEPSSHTASTTASTTATCGADGRWSSLPVTCTAKNCSRPSSENGKFDCTPPLSYGLRCLLKCSDGYFTNSSNSSLIECQANGHWSRYGSCVDGKGPNIACESNMTVYAGPRRGPVHVFWETPRVTDNSDEVIEVQSSPPNGSEFDYRQHVVTFTAFDSARNKGECRMVVNVRLITCEAYVAANFSEANCTHTNVYGSECLTTCHLGYQLDNPDVSVQVCQQNGTWSSSRPVCVALSCPPPPSGPARSFHCPKGQTFNQTCLLECARGYTVHGPSSIRCQQNIEWSQPGVCTDVEHPYFPRGCTDDIKVEAASFGAPNYVIYQLPEVEDNSGMNVTVSGNPVSGSYFKIGTTEVTVTATDPNGNNRTCSFNITVEYVNCSSPSIDLSGKNLIHYNCTAHHVLGAACGLSCTDGNPVQGVPYIRCHREDDGNLTWAWSGTTRPYCDVKSCPKLKSPRNGALACGVMPRSSGEVCFLSCASGTTYPSTAPEAYTCLTSSGTWRPRSFVPDCRVAEPPTDSSMDTEFKYFTSACNQSNSEIEQLFFSRLNKTELLSECSLSNCTLAKVTISCGQNRGRRRNRREATSLVYKIALTIRFGLLKNETDSSRYLEFYQTVTNSLDDYLFQQEDLGTLNIPALGEYQGFASSAVKFECNDAGTRFQFSTLLCAGCGPGHMYDNTTNNCRVCPKDTYQDQDISFSCTPCPNNTVTQAEMATSGDQCLDLCRPGQFSNNGIQPCDPCPVGSYQSKYGMTSCDLCPYSMSTVAMETTSVDNCVFFNTRLSETTSQAAIQIFDKIPTTFTFMTWVTSASTLLTSSLTFSLGSDQDNSTAAFLALDKIVLAIREQGDIEGLKVISKWNHLAVTYNSGTVRLYVDGRLTEERSGLSVTDLFQKSLTFVAAQQNGVQAVVVSGLQLTTSFYTELQLREFTTSCHKKVKTNLLARKPWEFLALSPSTCNDVNMCEGEPCGQHGTCISGLDTLQCLCHTPWSGDRCQVAPDFCADNFCANGATCVNLPKKRTYTCICAPNFKGKWCTNLSRKKNWFTKMMGWN